MEELIDKIRAGDIDVHPIGQAFFRFDITSDEAIALLNNYVAEKVKELQIALGDAAAMLRSCRAMYDNAGSISYSDIERYAELAGVEIVEEPDNDNWFKANLKGEGI